MRRWKGRWLIGVGLIHTVFSLIVFAQPLLAALNDGLFNAIDAFGDRALAFWFLFFGLLLFPLGVLIDWIEVQPALEPPRFVGYWLLGLSMMGCLTMPASGFWLLLPPAIGLMPRFWPVAVAG